MLIFRNTRGSAQGCANYLADELGLSPAVDVIVALPELDQTTRSVELRRCLEGGVAFHSTDLRKEERRLVENAFRDPNGSIKVLVATSTVAAGVNTPASSVIIVESEFVGGCAPTPYTVAGYKNMAGRAGRLGFSQDGKSILLADSRMDQDRLFHKYVQGTPERMVSSFDARHPETWVMRLLAQVKSVPRSEAFTLLANTYGGYLAARADANWRARFEPEVQALIDRMLQNGLVESDGDHIKLTMLGMACGQSPLQLNSALQLVEMIRALPVASVSPLILMVICEALPEMDADYTPLQRGRRGEPARQAELAARYGHQIAILLQRRAADDLTYHRRCKRALVLGDWLDGLSIDDIERAYTPNPFSRMAHGDIIGYADQARFFLQSALRVASIILAGAAFPDADAERLLNRLEIGIPEAALPLVDLPMALTRGEYLALSNAGVTSVEAVKALPLARLEELLGKRRAADIKQEDKRVIGA